MDWKKTDLWNFTKEHQECKIESWGGYVGKNDGYEPYGYIVYHENKIIYFGLDGRYIKTKVD